MSKLHYFVYPAVAALSLAAALAAHAETPTVDNTATQVWSQTKTRDQVRAELAQARADGSIKVWSTSYNPLTVARTEKTRDQVKAELKAARDADYAAAMYGEDSGSFYLAQVRPARSVGPVLAGKPATANAQ